MKKTLINSLYISLLIIAPVCTNFFLVTEQYSSNFHCPFDPWLLFYLALLAVVFAPMILALIQNTAHKIAISLLNLAVVFGSNTICKDGNQTGFAFVMGTLGALWLWQCFDGRRPKKIIQLVEQMIYHDREKYELARQHLGAAAKGSWARTELSLQVRRLS